MTHPVLGIERRAGNSIVSAGVAVRRAQPGDRIERIRRHGQFHNRGLILNGDPVPRFGAVECDVKRGRIVFAHHRVSVVNVGELHAVQIEVQLSFQGLQWRRNHGCELRGAARGSNEAEARRP